MKMDVCEYKKAIYKHDSYLQLLIENSTKWKFDAILASTILRLRVPCCERGHNILCQLWKGIAPLSVILVVESELIEPIWSYAQIIFPPG